MGIPKSEQLPVGTRLDRYGDEIGSFLSPQGTPYDQRALPLDTDTNSITAYVVIKELPVKSGETASWFGQPGGGKQFMTTNPITGTGEKVSIEWLRDEEYIKELE